MMTKQYLHWTCALFNFNKPTHVDHHKKNNLKSLAGNMKVNDANRQLLEALQDRNLSVDSKELLRDLSSEDQYVRGSWISENLGHETLLTKEELSL